MIYTYQHDDRTYTVNVEPQTDGQHRITVTSDGQQAIYIVSAQATINRGQLLAITDADTGLSSRRIIAHTAAMGDQRYVHLNGTHYTLTVPDARTTPRRGKAAAGDLTAQMPGQVVEVLVAEGDSVTLGQTLMILEAMKMEIRVNAPAAGSVKRLMVAAGDVVERGQHLVEISS